MHLSAQMKAVRKSGQAMSGGKYSRIMRSSSAVDMVSLFRRMLGLRYLSQEHFMPSISPKEGSKLRRLAINARGGGPSPILILGVMPRSGTNFIRDLVSRHPDVLADPGRLWEFPLLHSSKAMSTFTDQFVSYFPKNAEVVGQWDALAMLAGAWLKELQREAGRKHILLKAPHVQYLSLAPFIFPDAKIVLCLRDGRDVTASSLRTFSRWSPERKTFSQLAFEWQLGAKAILCFSPDQPRANPNITILRFEDAVLKPTQTLEKLLVQLGLDLASYPMDDIRNLPVRGSSQSDAKHDDRWQPAEKTADFNPIRRWGNWSASRRARFDRIAGDTLEAAGYDREG